MARQKKDDPIENNVVIYARYSSHSQTEQSIEGQLHDCYAYAERNGYQVVGEYIDRALTGTKDDRPDFQRMIRDAEKRQFRFVLVWKLDRFARNRYDSAFYKNHLRKHGVKVLSVMENIQDTPEGIILEGMLESLAEYYSANLSENIRRGLKASVAKGWYCGGSVPLGYKIQDHKMVPDEKTAPLIPELYRRYADGESLASIAEDFNARGYRTNRGRDFKTSTFARIVPNSAYIGEYVYAGEVVPGLATPLIERALYDRVLARRDQNRRAPAASTATVDFLLSRKLFCGVCGSPACGDAGTSKSGERHYYYSCSGRKHHRTTCAKKAEKKDFLEWYICEQTVEYVLSPERFDYIAEQVAQAAGAENAETLSAVKDAERRAQRLDDEVNSLMDKLIYAPTEAARKICERMQLLELQKTDIQKELARLRLRSKCQITKKEVLAWLKRFTKGDLFDMDFRSRLIDTFINCVYFYDDKVVIFYNIKEGRLTCKIDQIGDLDEKIEAVQRCSTLDGNGGALPPKVEHAFIFLHGMIGLVVFRN